MRWLRIGGIVGVVGFDLIVTDGPSVFTAVQDDLSLRLETRKHSVEVLVIDDVERTPKEN